MQTAKPTCPLCHTDNPDRLHTYTQPPVGETRFPFSTNEDYQRRLYACRTCGHMRSVHDFDLEGFYQDAYGAATYGNEGIQAAFRKILALPARESDNAGRVKRLVEFNAQYNRGLLTSPTVLDVGSGLCVFLYGITQAGWQGTAVEPDRGMADHARNYVKIDAVCASFMEFKTDRKHDFITFNKVLEHVIDPVQMLHKSHQHLDDGGCVYLELPDAEAAWRAGPGREEFFIEHYHIFSLASACLLARKAGFEALVIERLQEPSSKYTIRLFITPQRS